MKPLYIFDLDGTLALIEHRRHFLSKCGECGGDGVIENRDQNPKPTRNSEVEWIDCHSCKGGGKFKPDWKAFFAACIDDQPNTPVIDTLHALIEGGADVEVWSGRSSEVMEQTKQWLQDHLGVEDLRLCMRVEGDFTPDEILKRSWLESMSSRDRRRLVAVFDDRDKVVAMWRAAGVACFQVAPGEF